MDLFREEEKDDKRRLITPCALTQQPSKEVLGAGLALSSSSKKPA